MGGGPSTSGSEGRRRPAPSPYVTIHVSRADAAAEAGEEVVRLSTQIRVSDVTRDRLSKLQHQIGPLAGSRLGQLVGLMALIDPATLREQILNTVLQGRGLEVDGGDGD